MQAAAAAASDGVHTNIRANHKINAKLHDRHNKVTTAKGKTLRVTPHSDIKKVENPVSLQQNSENIPPGCFVNVGTFFDIQLCKCDIGYADHIIVQLQLGNPDNANPMALGSFFQLWDKIEIMPDGSTVQDTLYPEMMYLRFMEDINDEYRAQIGLNYGTNTATSRDPTTNAYSHTNYDAAVNGTGVIIPAGGSFTYYAEIPCILNHSHLFMPSLDPKRFPRIRFYPSNVNFRMKDPLNAYTTQSPVILQALFVINGPQFIPNITAGLHNIYSNVPAVSSGVVMERQIINYNPSSGVETADIVLNSIVGKIAALYIILRETGVTNEALFSSGTLANATWKQIESFTYKTSGGSVVSYEKQPVQLFRTTYWADHFKSGLAQEKAIMFYPFCKDFMSVIYHGCDAGSYEMTAKESIRFIPRSVIHNTFVDNAPMELLVYAQRYAEVIQESGVWKICKL